MVSEVKWYHIPADEIISLLQSSLEGITQEEAANRLARNGYNEVEPKKEHGPVYKFLKQFASPLIYVLLAASVVTFFLKEYADMTVILAVVLANAIIGFIQEYKAERALESLAKMLVPEASVIRNGQRRTIPSRELVAGDIVLLEAGDRVSADLRVFYVKNLRVDESILTGESMAAEKIISPIEKENLPPADQKNMFFAGTLITQGLGRGIVVATAKDTEIGKISEFIRQSGEMSTPLVKKIARLGVTLSVVILLISMFTFIIGILREIPPVEIFLAAVSLAVAAIPEGLPAVITISLAMGIKAMASKNAIIRTMPAVETLGSATVICSDKTGTLTKNQMTVTEIYTFGKMYHVTGTGYIPEGNFILNDLRMDPTSDPALIETLNVGMLCNDASMVEDNGIAGDPTEGALLIAGLKAGRFHMPRLDVIPFQSETRYMATLHMDADGNKIIYVKGSPEKIVKLCKYESGAGQSGTGMLDADRVHRAAEELAAKGLRIIGMAYKKVGADVDHIESEDIQNLVFVGLQGMIDPPREEVMHAIEKCKTAGIRVIMITGDHLKTAQSIAAQLGIETKGALAGSCLLYTSPSPRD